MSGHTFYPLRHWGGERRVVSGRFHPNGSSAIAEGSDKWEGFTVARTNAGIYTITFSDSYYHLEAFVPFLTMSALTGAVFLVGGAYSATAKTKVLTAMDEDNTSGIAAAADIASNADNYIDFIAVFRETSVDR